MYRRFLNNEDYYGCIAKETLLQLTKGNEERFIQAEQSAEMSIVEYLSENYEIEKELNKGKYIAEYNRSITYPIGAHIYFDGKINEVIRSISGFKSPTICDYWIEAFEAADKTEIATYSQFNTYYPDDLVIYNGTPYRCLVENGYKFNDIRIPLVKGWRSVSVSSWQPVEYPLWAVVNFEGAFYTLISLDGFDNNMVPRLSDCWGEIADYDPAYNEYEFSEHEYVVYEGMVFYPEIDVNADVPVIGKHLSPHDPRNSNLKKHMVRMALYELTKIIAPNNVGIVRMRDYDESVKWLSDASKLRINPQIPRRLAEDKQPVTDWQMSTFQTNYDPYKNPWLV